MNDFIERIQCLLRLFRRQVQYLKEIHLLDRGETEKV